MAGYVVRMRLRQQHESLAFLARNACTFLHLVRPDVNPRYVETGQEATAPRAPLSLSL